MSDQESFYDLLELNPRVEDAAAIEAAITRKRQQWARESSQGSPAIQRKAQLHLSRVGEIRVDMQDPARRKVHAELALKKGAQRRATVLAKLDAIIAMMAARGAPITGDEVRATAQSKEIAAVLTEQEVRSRFAAAGVVIETSPRKAEAAPARPQLEAAQMDALRRNLDLLELPSLYQLLEMSPQSSTGALRQKADTRSRELLRGGQTDAKTNAKKELCGACLTLFASEEQRKRYDGSLAVEPLRTLNELLEWAGKDKFVTVQEQDAYVKSAGDRGVRPEDAIAYLREYAQRRGWGVQGASTLTSAALRRCPHCHGVVERADARHCVHCSRALLIQCWRCSHDAAAEHAACPQCGLHLGDGPEAERLVAEARQQAAHGELELADAAIQQALAIWPGWPVAEQARREVAQHRSALDQARRELDVLLAARRYVEAEAFLRRTPRSSSEQALRAAGDSIARARSYCAQGDALRAKGATDAAVERYQAALDECADLIEARTSLSSLPPTTPGAPSCTSLGAGFRLSWAVASGASVRYVLVRKLGSAPQRPDDGHVVGEATSPPLDDNAAPAGTPLYYALFARRGDAFSREGARVGPLLVAADVGDAEAEPGARDVTVRWRRPQGALRVEVWKGADTPPGRRGEGRLLPASEDAVHDTAVQQGARYGYRVVAVYADPARSGAELFASGVPLVTSPVEPPPPVLDLRAERHGNRVALRWTAPPGAAVQIRRCVNAPPFDEGARLSPAALSRVGEPVTVLAPGAAESTIDRQGRVVFVPVSTVGSVCVMGRLVAVTTLDEVAQLATQTNGRDIVLTWTWPPGAAQVVVAYALDHFPPAPGDLAATETLIDHATYQRTRGLELRNLKPARYHFSVFVCSADGALHSAGVRVLEPMGQSTIVRYRVRLKKGGFLNRNVVSAWVELQCDQPLETLQPLMLRARDGQPPLGAADGLLLTEVDALRFEKGVARVEIPLASAGPSAFVKLFFKDGAHAREVRLMPAGNEELRLG